MFYVTNKFSAFPDLSQYFFSCLARGFYFRMSNARPWNVCTYRANIYLFLKPVDRNITRMISSATKSYFIWHHQRSYRIITACIFFTLFLLFHCEFTGGFQWFFKMSNAILSKYNLCCYLRSIQIDINSNDYNFKE